MVLGWFYPPLGESRSRKKLVLALRAVYRGQKQKLGGRERTLRMSVIVRVLSIYLHV